MKPMAYAGLKVVRRKLGTTGLVRPPSRSVRPPGSTGCGACRGRQPVRAMERRRKQRGDLGAPTSYNDETVENCLVAGLGISSSDLGSHPFGLNKRSANRRSRAPKVPDQRATSVRTVRSYTRIPPGRGRWYDETEIDPSKGERWFCTEGTRSRPGGDRQKHSGPDLPRDVRADTYRHRPPLRRPAPP